MEWSGLATLLTGPLGEKTGLASRLLNISEFGLRVVTTIPIAPGQQVEVIPVDGPQYPLACRVVWVGAPGTAEYGQAGLEFFSPIPLMLWGPAARRSPAPPAERQPATL